MNWSTCADCPAVDLMPESVPAWELYSRSWNQIVVAGTGEVIGLNVLAIDKVMDMMQIPAERRLEILDQVLAVHDITFPIRKKGDKGKAPKEGGQ